MRGLRGGFIAGGGGGEPIRNPDAYPTGKNFYGIDPDKVPKPASYEMGIKLADQMLADHVKKHGKYPEKVSFVIWGDETMRHEGVLESQIFHLLGHEAGVGRARQGRRRGGHSARAARTPARGHRHRLGRRRDVQQRHAC